MNMEESAQAQIGERTEDRKSAIEQRAAKREELSVTLSTAAVEAKASKEARESLEKRLGGDVKIETPEFEVPAIEAAQEIPKQSGPTGTFSAFGAAIAGATNNPQQKMVSVMDRVDKTLKAMGEATNGPQEKIARVMERVDKTLESIDAKNGDLVKQAKKKNVARFA